MNENQTLLLFAKCPPWSPVPENAAKTRFGVIFALFLIQGFSIFFETALAADDGVNRAPVGSETPHVYNIRPN